MLNGQKFWLVNKPRDFINGRPLFVEYEDSYIESAYQSTKQKYYHQLNRYDSSIVIFHDSDLLYKEVYKISEDDHSNYWYEERYLKMETPDTRDTRRMYSSSSPGFTLYSTVYTSFWTKIAIVLTDYSGHSYSYVVYHDEQKSKLSVERADILRHRSSNDGIKNVVGDSKNVSVTFYSFIDWPFDEYTSITENISVESFADDVIELMLVHTGIRINNLWYEGKKLCVDLNVFEGAKFNMGSSGSAIRFHDLMYTLSSFPYVERIEVLVDGQRGVAADHFSFERIFEAQDFKK
jgi:hypothetical protein